MTLRARRIAVVVTIAVITAAIAVVVLLLTPREDAGSSETPAPAASAVSSPAPDDYRPPTADELAALPEATATMEYVIGGLMPFEGGSVDDEVYHLTADAPVYGSQRDEAAPMARLNAESFLREPTVVVVSRFEGDWALILTPARIALPSASANGEAPAQSAGWVRRDLLTASHEQTHRVVIDVEARTMTVMTAAGETVETFPVGVGGPETPSPTGTTYLQARYLDPAQGQYEHRIQLTAAYSAQSDAPWLGSAHIGLHFSTEPDAESHGCVRLTAEGLEAIDRLPLGTVVEFHAGA